MLHEDFCIRSCECGGYFHPCACEGYLHPVLHEDFCIRSLNSSVIEDRCVLMSGIVVFGLPEETRKDDFLCESVFRISDVLLLVGASSVVLMISLYIGGTLRKSGMLKEVTVFIVATSGWWSLPSMSISTHMSVICTLFLVIFKHCSSQKT